MAWDIDDEEMDRMEEVADLIFEDRRADRPVSEKFADLAESMFTVAEAEGRTLRGPQTLEEAAKLRRKLRRGKRGEGDEFDPRDLSESRHLSMFGENG